MAKHRKARRPVIAGAALVPVSAMAVIAGAGHAGATPTTSQPGVTPPTTSQPGVTSPGTPSQPGVTTKPSTTNEWKYVPGFDPGPYRNVETIPEPGSVPTQAPTPAPAAPAAPSPAPSYQGDGGGQQAYYYQAPQPEQAAPEVVENTEADLLTEGGLVKPIQAEDGMVRIGLVKGERPDWLSEEYADQINNTSAVMEAQGATAFNSLGIPTTRSQRIAAGTIGGAVVGATIGAAVVGIPAAAVGGLVGGTIGGSAAVVQAVTSIVPATVVFPVVGTVVTGFVLPTALTVGGAAIGAAAVGIPVAAAGAVVGGTIGGVIGGAFGAGQNVGEAQEVTPAPPAPFDKDALTAQTRQVVAQIESVPGGTVVTDGFRGASDAFQAALDNGRNAIAAQPNGEGILAQIDGADQAIKNVLNPTHEAADAIGIGIHVPVPEPTPAPAGA